MKLQVPFESCSFHLLRYHSLWAHVFLQIWDSAGRKKDRDITKAYYCGSHALLIVYDITRRVSDVHPSVFCAPPLLNILQETFANVRFYVEQILQRADPTSVSNVVLIGFKTDLGEKREVTREENTVAFGIL